MKHLLTLTLALLASALTAPSASATVHGTDFEKKIVFSPSATALAKIGETSWTDFPVLVRLPASVSSQLQSADGTDLYIEDENGDALVFEVETFDPAGTTFVWVKVPSLSSATALTVFFGGSANADNDPTAVWSRFVGVWHFDDAAAATTTVVDATGHGLNGTTSGTLSTYAGPFGGDTLQCTEKINAPDYDSLLSNVAQFSVSGWFKAPNQSNAYHTYASKKAGLTWNADKGWYLEMSQSKTKANLVLNGSNNFNIPDVSVNWNYFHLVSDGSTVKVYMNGSTSAAISKNYVVKASSQVFLICGKGGCSDEYRIRGGAASAAETALEYATMADAAFFDAGAITSVDATAQKFDVPTAVRNANGTTTVTVVLTANNGDVGVIYDDGASAITNLLAAAAAPGTFTDTPANLASDTTYQFSAYGKNANGTEVVEKGGVFHTGDLSITKVSDADENGLVPGSFRISRADTAHDLVVNLSVGGTATVGQTYEALPATVTIPAGASSVDVPVVPIMDKATDADATVTVTLAAGLYGVSASAGTATLTIANLVAPAGYNTWVASADGLASDGSNWSEGRAPTASDNILFDGRFSNANCTWDTSAAVASWTQAADYTGTVQIETTYASGAFPLLSIAGDCAVNGGTWTHHTNTNVANGAAAQYRLNVSVGGDFTLGSGAKIDVIGRGYNVGRCPSGSQVGVHAATGRGTYSAVYGDVHAPEDIGSGGENSNKNSSAGGGAVKIAVAGAAVIDGTIAANAASQRLNGNNPEKGYGAGGSVFVTASSISGSGKVDVSARPAGISETAYTGYPGSGGRMALVATVGNVTIPMANLLANGSVGSYSAGAGTIYLKNASDTNGSLLVGNGVVGWSYIVRYPRKDGCTCVKPGETWVFDHIYVRDSGILSVPANATLSLPGGFESVSSLTDSSTPLCGILYLGGTISLPVLQ